MDDGWWLIIVGAAILAAAVAVGWLIGATW